MCIHEIEDCIDPIRAKLESDLKSFEVASNVVQRICKAVDSGPIYSGVVATVLCISNGYPIAASNLNVEKIKEGPRCFIIAPDVACSAENKLP